MNGRIASSALTVVEDDDRLIHSAANAYLALKRAAAAAGRYIAIAEPAGAYRTYEVQVDMHLNPDRYALNPDFTGTLAAAGTSGHGDGNCIDIVGDLAWVIANAYRFGWSRPLRNDPNHFQHDGSTATTPPRNPTASEDDMRILIIAPYNLPDRGVIGDVAYAFRNETELAHFKNVWRPTLGPIVDGVTTVGGPKSTPDQNRVIFNTLIRIHRGGS